MQYSLTADGATAAFGADGSFRISAIGTFGGGTLVIEEDLLNNGVFSPVEGTDKTSDAGFIVDGLVISTYRASLSGATSPNITIIMKGGQGQQ